MATERRPARAAWRTPRTGSWLPALAGCALLLGCQRGRAPAVPARPEPGGTLRVGIFEPFDFLSPALGAAPSTRQFLVHVTPPLGVIDENRRVQLRLARWYEDAGSWLEFTLRPVRWEDGVPVTAADLVLTSQLVRDHRTRSPERYRLDLVGDVRARDDSTLRFSFDTSYGRRTRDALLMPLASHALPAGADPEEIRSWPLSQKPLSCGPFRVLRSSTYELVLERNASSSFPPSHLERVEVRTLLSAEDAVRDFRAGKLDVIDALPAGNVGAVRSVPGARILALVGRSYLFVGWNLHDARFSDLAVRRAAAQAVDVQRIIDDLTLEQGDPARGPLVPVLGFEDTTRVLRHDPSAAKRELERAGWRDQDGDGVRERRGARLEFHILAGESESLRLAAAHAVARDLERVGMRAEVRALPLAEMVGRLSAHAFEAFVGEWFPDPGLDLDPVWRSDADESFNFGGYASAAADSLLTLMHHELADFELDAVMARFQARVYADQPYLFLFENPRFVVLSQRVQGARPSVLETFWNLPEWWIPKAQQNAPATVRATP